MVGIPKIYVKIWWLLFLAMKFTFFSILHFHKFGQLKFLFLKVHGGGGSTGLGNIQNKYLTIFLECFPSVMAFTVTVEKLQIISLETIILDQREM